MTKRVVVVGAGVVGLVMALRLSKCSKSLDIRVIDAAPNAPEDEGDYGLRVSAIANASLDAMDECLQYLPPERQCTYDRMRVWDAADAVDSQNAIDFSAAEFAVPQLGKIMDNAATQRALLSCLAAADVRVSFDTRVAEISRSDNQWRIDLAEGGTVIADLVIAADGGKSPLREALGIQSKVHDYQQTAVVTHLRPTLEHTNTAFQRFLPSGPIALLPLSDGRVSTVWSLPTEQARAVLELDVVQLADEITRASDSVLGALTVDGPVGRFPLQAQHAETYVRTGAVLIGDAAHSIHPMAGQGANLGIQDAVVLARCIDAALAAGMHPGEPRVLRRYERERREANATMLNGLSALNALFKNNSAVVSSIRRSGMRVFNHSGPLRWHVVQTALGDLSRWLR